MKCRSEGSADGTSLASCVKIYVPLGKDGASEAPYGFVFELEKRSDGTLGLDFLALVSATLAMSGPEACTSARTGVYTAATPSDLRLFAARPLPLPLPPPCQIGTF